MSSNNPRKKREAEKVRASGALDPIAAAASGELSRVDDITVMVGSNAGAVGSGMPAVAKAGAGVAGDVGMQAKAAADALQAKAAAAAAAANATGEGAVADSAISDPSKAGALAANDVADTSSDVVSADPASPEAEAETVSFTSATELLNQTQQQIKKAKSEAARQKRAKEMEEAQKKARKRKIRRRIILAVIGVLIIALCALALVFCAERWWLHDDEYDIQGTWQVEGTDTSVTITEDSIVLTDEVAYRYDINPEDKTITFNFGTLAGEGHYRFSLDRNQLSITDGTVEDASSSLIEDIGWWISASLSQAFGHQLTPTIDSSALALERA